jgi:hypothetical protein
MTVRVVGFATIASENTALYRSSETARQTIAADAVWLAFPAGDAQKRPEGWSAQWALVEGTFDLKSTGHKNAFAGSIQNIRRFEAWSDNVKQ